MDMYIIHVCLMRAVCFRVRMYICVMSIEIACICTHSVSRMYFFRFISLHQSHSITCNFYKFFLLIISFVNVIYGGKNTISIVIISVRDKKEIDYEIKNKYNHLVYDLVYLFFLVVCIINHFTVISD